MANVTQPFIGGQGHIFGLATLGFGMKQSDGSSTIPGYISPNFQSAKLRHTGTVERIKGQMGDITGILTSGEYLECDFDFIPEAANLADTLKSARIPPGGTCVQIYGLPVIAIGSFDDAFNSTTGAPWFYEFDGTYNAVNDSKATVTLTLRRYPAILNPAAIIV